MGDIVTGNYHISNFDNGNYASLKSAKQGTPVTASKDVHSTDKKWIITKLNSGYYTIRSLFHGVDYAKVGYPPSAGEVVKGRFDEYQWVIYETPRVGEYLIYPFVNDGLFWSLANGEAVTPVKLSMTNRVDSKAHWNLKRV